MPSKVRNWPEHPTFAANASTRGKAKPETHPEAEGTSTLGILP